ncbi:MAG: SNF2-related protein [Thermodesulfobacteriota bacterium]|nr:SNF2-related protein [Thermodesulfobacteriota bacterium]
MPGLSEEYIRKEVADSLPIYHRGKSVYANGSFFLAKKDPDHTTFVFQFDGNYGDYTTRIQLNHNMADYSCTCPYPGNGCKHVVAALLNTRDILDRQAAGTQKTAEKKKKEENYLSEEEIKSLAISDRKKKAAHEKLTLEKGDMYKGDHKVKTPAGRTYTVTLHDPENGLGHCTCPDYLTNGLGFCKHIFFSTASIAKEPGFKKQSAKENFPFIDLYWDSLTGAPKLFSQRPASEISDLTPLLDTWFNETGEFLSDRPGDIMGLITRLQGDKRVCIRENLLKMVDHDLQEKQLSEMEGGALPDHPILPGLYPYQKKGVEFGLFKKGFLLGDEMGLGKTLQAIALAVLKKEVYGFSKVLIVTLASLKEQWKREIEKFSSESAVVVAGSPQQRENAYFNDTGFFKITNYEAVLRDVTVLTRFEPDIIILDEAQRIRNFSTKTADAVKRIPKKHALVLTGTPLENKLEDIYSIVQFLDPYMLTPLWQFAADHFLISKTKKSSIAGYRNLDLLNKKLKRIVLRRKKEEVIEELPDEVVNNYYIDLSEEQHQIHGGYSRSLIPLMNKKFLTPMDLRKIQVLLLRMRMVCDSTYLIDRSTQISPKLKELETIIDELVIQNQRKMVIFSEWTTMTYLIARHLSNAEISFVELSGKVPVKRRQELIDAFTNNPDCRVFLSTDAGGTGLNLQAADCVVNFELPWNPAKMNQRIGRVSRIGQTSSCINVINLIAKRSIEESILAGIQLKTDLFEGVFDEGPDTVEFSREKRNEVLNSLREMMDETAAPAPSDPSEPEEIPEDTPYYLNPEILNPETLNPEIINKEKDDNRLKDTDTNDIVYQSSADQEHSEAREGLKSQEINPDIHAESETPEDSVTDPGVSDEKVSSTSQESGDNILASQPKEKIETVLNSGMAFIGGLMEMATGKKMESTAPDEKMVTIDSNTGEVTMKFKLPGF